jgi:asparagine synthase (glutamine-hydrolysing)
MSPNVRIGEDFNDDANCAKKFAEDFKLNHHSVIVTPDSVKANWDASMHTMEQPVYNMSIPMYYQTNKYLSEKGVVVTMAGDMGDELLGGYPKYWKLRNDPPKSFEDMIWKWMHRIKRPVQLTNKINPKDIHAELCKVIPQDVWNPEDPINSYMAVDCITQVPEEFFSRNDKFGMQFSMEGRFPLATKRFMTYCMDMHSQYKIGKDKSDTKLPTKLAYKGHMPDYIINKMKTGWTVPLMYWLGTMKELNDWAMSYMLKEDCLRSQISMKNWDNKKTRVVSWMMRSWAQIYDIQS